MQNMAKTSKSRNKIKKKRRNETKWVYEFVLRNNKNNNVCRKKNAIKIKSRQKKKKKKLG